MMKLLRNHDFWWIFGIFGYPCLCFLSWKAGLLALELFHWRAPHYVEPLDSLIGPLFGIPLGVVSSFSAVSWEHELYPLARFIALLGGVALGGDALNCFHQVPFSGWVEYFGLMAPTFAWAGCLIMFAIMVRPPAKSV